MNRSASLFVILLWFIASASLQAQDTISLNFDCQTVVVGDTTCISISTSDIPALSSAQFTLHFDPNAFGFVDIANIHPEFTVDPLTFSPVDSQGFFVVAWISQSPTPITFAAGSVLFEVCLEAKGPPGQYLVNAFASPADIEFGNDGNPLPFHEPEGCLVEVVAGSTLEFYSTNCFDQTNMEGIINVQVHGGTEPYTLTYTGPAMGNANINTAGEIMPLTGLPAGMYTFNITDASGNTLNNQIVDLSNSSGQIIITPDSDGPICPGGNEGFIELSPPFGGVAPFSYAWSTGAIGVTALYDLPDGDYDVTVTDARGCSTVEAVSFSTPSFFLDTLQFSNPSCGQANGRITMKAEGGTSTNQGFFDYAWTLPSGTLVEEMAFGTGAPSRNRDLEAGIYTVTITDELDCSGEFTIDFRNDRELMIDTANFTEISCFGGANGSVTVTAIDSPAMSAVGNIVVELIYPDGSSNAGVQFNNLGPGDYQIIARDDDCMSTLDFSLTDPAPFDTAFTIVRNESCNADDDGAIRISMAGGSRPYSYAWSNGAVDSFTTGLNEGPYNVMVTDANGCSQQFDFNLTKAEINFKIDTIQNILCPGEANGQLGISGISTFESLSWSTGQNTNTIANLAPGTYTVTITDGACAGIDSATLSSPTPIALNAISIVAPSCAGGNDGTIDVDVSGGTEPYQYDWEDGSNFRTLTLVEAGQYSVSVTDANNCSALVIDTVVTDPVAMLLQFINIDSVSCFSPEAFGPDGGAEVLVSNGAPPYFYAWANGETGPTANSLEQGWNFLTIADNDNCQVTDSVFIPSPDQISLDTIQTEITQPTCFGDTDGSINVQAMGGKPGYGYLWPNPDGSPGWIDPLRSNIGTGTYLVLVRDANSCTDSLFVTLPEPAELIAAVDSIDSSNETCDNSNDGRITINTQGGNDGLYVYQWTNNVSVTETATMLDTGTYDIIVTDVRGCADTVTQTISGPSPIIYTFTGETEINCNGEQILLNLDGITGGNEPTDYNISFNGGPSQSNNNPISVAAGSYMLNISDKLGCSIDTNITITEPPVILIDFGEIDPLDLGDSVRILVTVAGGTNVFIDYAWDQLTNLNCMDPNCLEFIASPTSTTQYQLVVTDSSGCMQEAVLNIEVLLRRNVFIPNAFSPNGDGINDIFRLYTGPGVSRINYLSIYDRWGNQIFTQNDIMPSFGGTEGWNGQASSELLNSGVYVYVSEVEFIDGTVLIYRGEVTLVK